jgi:NTE family protein
MEKMLALVFGGGGSRGALQVGALQALLESGLQPDLLVGSSIGAVNATYLALHGLSQNTLDGLAQAWREVAAVDLLPANYVWLAVRAMLGRSRTDPAQRIKEVFITHGITPEMTFASFHHPRLVIVSSDLNTGQPVLHGLDANEGVLDALFLSTALPPWAMPVKKHGRYEMDGGLVSNLPIQPALHAGATEIVALDLIDARGLTGTSRLTATSRLTGIIERVSVVVEKRQADLEMALAKAHGVPICYIDLVAREPVALWDFQHSDALITEGYEITRRALEDNKEWLEPGKTIDV